MLSVLPHLSQAVALSLDSLAIGVVAARLVPDFAALPYALAFGLSDALAALLGRGIGAGYGMVLLLTGAFGVAAIDRRRNAALGWRTAAGVALPLLFGLDSLVCPVALADLPELTLASTSLALAGLMIGRVAGRSLPVFGQGAVLALVGLLLFV